MNTYADVNDKFETEEKTDETFSNVKFMVTQDLDKNK